MAVDLKALGLDQLTADQKRELAETLLDEADAEPPPPSRFTDAERAELDRRIADADANPDDYFTWEEVQASIRKRLGR